MPEPGKKKRTRKSTSRATNIKGTNGVHAEPPAPAAESAFVEAGFVEPAEVAVEPAEEAPVHEQEPVVSSAVEPTTEPERTVGIYRERGIEGLLRDNGFMNEMVHAMTQSKVMDSLAEDVADKLKDSLGSNPEFRQRLVKAVVSTESFRRKMVRAMGRISK